MNPLSYYPDQRVQCEALPLLDFQRQTPTQHAILTNEDSWVNHLYFPVTRLSVTYYIITTLLKWYLHMYIFQLLLGIPSGYPQFLSITAQNILHFWIMHGSS